MNHRLLFLGTLIAACALSALPLRADDGAPRMVPGQTFTLQFADMPPTFAELLDPTGIPPPMTVFLPRNYDPQRRHPLLIFLGGGGGSRGQNPVVARKLTEETDFVCVDLPLFKETLDPPASGNGMPRLILQANDCRFMWQHCKVMLAKLEFAVPNMGRRPGRHGGRVDDRGELRPRLAHRTERCRCERGVVGVLLEASQSHPIRPIARDSKSQ